jgi:hypothetical protein
MSASDQTIELYLRSLSPQGNRARQRAVLERLKTLDIEGEIGGYDVHVCGKCLPANPDEMQTKFGTFLRNQIAVFELWAAKNELPLDSLFQRQKIESSYTGESYTELVVPTMVLVEYEGSTLRFVTPCKTDDQNWTVTDRLKVLPDQDIPDGIEALPDARSTPPNDAESRTKQEVTSRSD